MHDSTRCIPTYNLALSMIDQTVSFIVSDLTDYSWSFNQNDGKLQLIHSEVDP